MDVALHLLAPRRDISRCYGMWGLPLHSASIGRHYDCLIQVDVLSNPPEAGWLSIQIVHLGRVVSQGPVF